MTPPDPASAGRLDAAAVARTLRRLARAPSPPWLHAEVARRMAERLQIIRLQPRQLLDWWSFLGGGSELLVAAYPKARRIVVEPTPALQERSRAAARQPWWSAGRWSGAGVDVLAESEQPPSGTQLVWANMMLPWVADPPALFARWQQLLAVDGFVMFSCLGPGTLQELRSMYVRLGWPAPATDYIDMHDLGDMLVEAGFADPVMDQETLTLRWDSAAALLTELRAWGGNTAPGRFAGWRTGRWRQCLEHELELLRGPDGKLGLSFEVAYGHAFKAPPRVRPGEVATVSLEDMRAMVRAGHGPKRALR
jgi:malonyl-CoA O-methyltransferase